MFYSQIIAAPDPTPFRKPRFISWPSVCDTTRTNWLAPEESAPAAPSPALQNHVEYACLFDPRSDQPIDPRVLDACSSIDCFAPPADVSLTFSAIAAPPPVSPDLYTTTICAPGVPLPAPPRPQPEPNKPRARTPKRRGRPVVFDEVKRAEFVGMLKTGCTIRYAARRVGVDPATVRNACQKDPLFAEHVDRAQQERDILSVRRIQNAGEKSWRAAAWLLERNEPKEFSLQHKKRDPFTVRRQRRLKKIITEVVDNCLADRQVTNKRGTIANAAVQLVDDRLAEIESQSRPYRDAEPRPYDLHSSDGRNDDSDEDEFDEHEFDEDNPGEDFEENDGYASEEAAVEAYRRMLRKMNRAEHEVVPKSESYRQQLRKWNEYLRVHRRPR